MEPRVLVIGESLVDIVRTDDGAERELPGGSGANTAIALARLGRSVHLATAFAPDPYGELLARHLAADEVALACAPGAIGRTSTALARIGADGAATYTFDIDWALNPMTPGSAGPDAVHLTSLAAILEPGCTDVRDLIEDLRSSATITYDINVRASVTGVGPGVVAAVESMARLADVVKASDEDLETLWPDVGVEGVAARMIESGVAAVIITRGAGGASYRTADDSGDIPSTEVEVLDTIGAGDTFSAAMIDALAERDLLGADARTDLRRAGPSIWRAVLGWATRAAAVTVSRPGADPPYRHQLI